MIAVISGTNRPGSRLRAAGGETELLDLRELPPELFLPDAYAAKPASFARFNDVILRSEGVLLVTPEYNGGFPGVLKVFIDHLKFPESFERRPVAFVGVAAGMWGARIPVEQLTQLFTYRSGNIFGERVFLPRIDTLLTPDGTFTSSTVDQLVSSQVKNFLDFCRKLRNP
jgi:NAD(P)H-dependent FMN reductase